MRTSSDVTTNSTGAQMLPSWALGLSLAICGYTLCGLGMNLIKLSHLRSPSSRTSPARETRFNRGTFVASKARLLCIFGYAVNCTGGCLNTIGLRYAAQTLLAPVSSMALISNCFFATVLLGERINLRSDALPMMLIPTGNFLAIAAANHSNPHAFTVEEVLRLFQRRPFCIYAVLCLCVSVVLMLLKLQLMKRVRQTGGPDHAHPTLVAYTGLTHAAAAALLCVNSVFISKALLLTLAHGLRSVWHLQFLVLFCVWAVLALFWLFNLSNLLRSHDALFVVPCVETLWCIGSLVSGGIFFDEYSALSARRKIQFACGVAISFTGVYQLSRRVERSRNSSTEKLG